MVTTLYQAGVDAQQICSITRHKNESTLSHYIASSSNQQKQRVSNVLSASILGEPEIIEHEKTVDYTNNHEVAIGQNRDVTANPPSPSSKSANLLQSLMANANFHNCTFNFHGFSGQSGHQ